MNIIEKDKVIKLSSDLQQITGSPIVECISIINKFIGKDFKLAVDYIIDKRKLNKDNVLNNYNINSSSDGPQKIYFRLNEEFLSVVVFSAKTDFVLMNKDFDYTANMVLDLFSKIKDQKTNSQLIDRINNLLLECKNKVGETISIKKMFCKNLNFNNSYITYYLHHTLDKMVLIEYEYKSLDRNDSDKYFLKYLKHNIIFYQLTNLDELKTKQDISSGKRKIEDLLNKLEKNIKIKNIILIK